VSNTIRTTNAEQKRSDKSRSIAAKRETVARKVARAAKYAGGAK
jgi:hypothetical protein